MAKFHENLQYHDDTTVKHGITLQEIQFLQKLQKEMNTQDTVCQADPRFWVIAGIEKTCRCDDDSAENYCLYDSDACETVADTLEDTLEYINQTLEENESEYMLTPASRFGLCDVKIQDECEETLYNINDFNDWLHRATLEQYELIGYRMTEKIYRDVMFLTEKDAAEHLRKYHYNYDAEAHTYAMTAYRSPRVEELYKILQTVDFNALASIYTKQDEDLPTQFAILWGMEIGSALSSKELEIANEMKQWDSTELQRLFHAWAYEYTKQNENTDIIEFFQKQLSKFYQTITSK